MKNTILVAAATGLLLLSVSGLRAENFAGSDDFSNNSIDLNKWTDAYGSFGAFTETNQHMELDMDYDGGGTPGSVQGTLPWKLNYGSYALDWEVYYDVEVPSFSLFSGNESSQLTIAVCTYPLGTSDAHAELALEQGTHGDEYRRFQATMYSESDNDGAAVTTSSINASLRIRWDASATTLYCEYDDSGSASNWTNLRSWNIASQQYSWNMTTGDVFMCILFGEGTINHTGETNPSGDNFVAIGTYPEAPLALFRPSSGLWALRGITRTYFGGSNDTPVYSDYDGDGTKDIAIFRGTSGLWAIRGITRAYFGGSSDEPVPGDYNDDGNSDIAIFRESTGLWAVRGLTRSYFGTTDDIPLEP